jgi:DNA-directed RNA polymerase sigma subunit (sigma70/sigma32)
MLSGSLHEHWTGQVPYHLSIDAAGSDGDGPTADCTVLVKNKDADNNTDSNVIANESSQVLNELIEKLLSKLSGYDKIVIQLAFGIDTIDGQALSVPEIAKNLGMTKKAIQMHYDQAMLILAKDKEKLLAMYFKLL